jgi:CHASE2 domain-containing sensor protein
MWKYLLIILLLINLGCVVEKSFITIVDIGRLDRNGIAKELSIINKYSPKVIGLDFLLTTDSLEKDTSLSRILSQTKKMVQASTLHNNHPLLIARWGSLEMNHPKFRFGRHGFSNITITNDSVIVRELPMRQYYRTQPEFAFAYQVAIEYDSNRINPKYRNDDKDFAFEKNSFGRYFKVISVEDLMAAKFDKDDLIDKIVLVGHVSNTEDSFFLNENDTERIAGVEIQACIIKQILN